MALARYRVTASTGSIIRQAHFPEGTEVDVPPDEPPRRSWVPLNAEAVQAFVDAKFPVPEESKALLKAADSPPAP